MGSKRMENEKHTLKITPEVMGEGDSSHDGPSKTFSGAYHLFVEKNEAMGYIDALSSNETQQREEALQRFRAIVDKYLECPTLLDQSLESMVHRLVGSILPVLHGRECNGGSTSPLVDEIRYSLSALYALSKVRGRKCIQRFLPHGVADVEPVWNALQLAIIQTQKDESSSVAADAPLWQSIYMLWNWMSVLSLVPFDTTVLADDNLIPSLMNEARQHLSQAGPTREAASASLAAWLSRPDLEQKQLPAFIQWSKSILKTYTDENRKPASSNLFQILGILQTVTTILKVSSTRRERLVELVHPLWETLLHLHFTDNLLLRKLLVKWWTRMSCAYLPPRIAPWRYERGKRSLVDNLNNNDDNTASPHVQDEEKSAENYLSELFHVPDQVEDAMGRVIEALSHPSTMVRWSAAKGVGRITERLPAICAEDVLDAVLQYFEDPDRDHCWHGACLALAELARRGLLLPSRLGDVVPQIVLAVQYDRRRGQTSVGAHVRDAACYAYWAFARAYSPAVLRPYLSQLSESIVLTSLFDREVNCRRAASAAFQEAVGRQGATNFPHGIAILTKADYFSLGNRNDAYTSIALSVASFNTYRTPIIHHLYSSKLFHWDTNIRSLASKSLHGLTSLDPTFVAGSVIPCLMEKCLDETNLHVRHGAVLGVAETVLALSESGQLALLSEKDVETLTSLVARIEKKRLYRGRGGEIMRSAVCRLVECISIARVPLSVNDQVRMLDSVDSSITHPSETIQESACLALKSLMTSYFPVGENGPSQRLQSRVVDKFVSLLDTSDNPAATRGYALALGHLPAKVLAPSASVLGSVLACLRKAARYDAVVGGESDAETRRNSILSLASISETAGVEADYPRVGLSAEHVSDIFESFLLALNDYKTDRRGDVGSWCRMAGMQGMTDLIFLSVEASKHDNAFFDPLISTRLVGALLKQLAEKLDTVRQLAGDSLERILRAEDPTLPGISRKVEIMAALGLDDGEDGSRKKNWADPSFTYPRVMQAALLEEPEYFGNVVAGIVISIGGMTKNVSRHATLALLDWAKGADRRQRAALANQLLLLLEQHRGSGRIILPVLKTLEELFCHQCFDDLVQSSCGFADKCQRSLQKEEVGCRDVRRLLAIVDVAVALLHASPVDNSVTKRALAFLCRMLAHNYPRVRSHTAHQFYVHLTERETNIGSDSVVELILNTPWGSDSLDDQPKVVDEIVEALDVGR